MPNYLADIIQKVFDGTNAIRTTISAGDIEIGAVEIKDGTSDTRAAVNAGLALQVAPIGNVTLSDSKGFIGLVTVGNTIASTFTGNLTLDAGSKTQIAGNVTLSDSKTYIGLVTVTQASSARTITGNITLSDPKTFIGLVTVTDDAYSFNNFAGDGTVLIKSGAGKLHTLTINAKSVGGPCILYDSLVPSGTKIASIDTTLSTTAFLYDINFTTGLTLDTSAVTTAGDLTVSYK